MILGLDHVFVKSREKCLAQEEFEECQSNMSTQLDNDCKVHYGNFDPFSKIYTNIFLTAGLRETLSNGRRYYQPTSPY